jgi:hypothetical protein
MRADGYDSSREVWRALSEEPNTAVVSASLVPSGSGAQNGGSGAPFELSGFNREDRTVPDDTYVLVENPQTHKTERLRVIGVLETTATDIATVATSEATLQKLAGAPVPPQRYVFRLDEGVDATKTARALEAAFVANGLQATVVANEVRSGAESSMMMYYLLTGFMGLGLLAASPPSGSSRPARSSKGASR